MEEEEERQLPFLDVLVRWDTQQFHTSVFRNQPMQIATYLNYRSSHHATTKIVTILCLKRRTEVICQREILKKELQHIEDTMTTLGDLWERHCIRKSKKDDEETEEQERILYLLYIKGISENLQRPADSLTLW